MLFIDGRFSRDRTVASNVGHSCCRSYQRYADLVVGRHPASTGVLSIPERQKSTTPAYGDFLAH
jgi:cytochrome c peroxidase